jgi:hypothetical protein
VAGIIAAGVAAYLLWKNWDKVTRAFQTGLTWIVYHLDKMTFLGRAVIFAIAPMAGLGYTIYKNWEPISGVLSQIESKGQQLGAWAAEQYNKQALWTRLAVAVFNPVGGAALIVRDHWNQLLTFFKGFGPKLEAALPDWVKWIFKQGQKMLKWEFKIGGNLLQWGGKQFGVGATNDNYKGYNMILKGAPVSTPPNSYRPGSDTRAAVRLQRSRAAQNTVNHKTTKIDKLAINVNGAGNPVAVAKEVKKQLSIYLGEQEAATVGA